MYESTYEGPFKFCPQDGTPLPVHERICPACGLPVSSPRISTWSVWIILPLLTILITFLLVNLNQYVYSTFQQDSCTLTATWDTLSLGYGIYTPTYGGNPRTITYKITDAQGQVVAQGTGSLGLQSHSPEYPALSPENQRYVQNPVDQLSKTTTCWYSPYALPHVLWNQPGGSNWWWLWFFGTGTVLVLLYLCILRLIIYPQQLARRGVQTTGIVVDRMKRHVRQGYYYIAVVKFLTKTTPSLASEERIREDLPMGSKQDVVYDPRNPFKNHKVTSLFSPGRANKYTVGAILLILLLLGAQALIVLSTCNF